MRSRWCVADLLGVESKVRRMKGHRAMSTLVKSLGSLVRERSA